MSILILGNKGSLGKALQKRLSHEHHVLGLDIEDFDLTKYEDYPEQFEAILHSRLEKVIIINCAGIMGARESEVDPFKYYEVNGIIPYKLRRFFASHLSNHLFVQISSETVYGMSADNKNPFQEDDTCSPQHNYGLSKLMAEQLLKSTSEMQGDTVILRVPIILFENQKYSNALHGIYNEINKTSFATLLGKGEHQRQYIIVDKLVGDIETILNCWHAGSENISKFDIINMPGTALSPREFVRILKDEFNSQFNVKFEINHKLAFSLVSSSEKFSFITSSTNSSDSTKTIVEWIIKTYE